MKQFLNAFAITLCLTFMVIGTQAQVITSEQAKDIANSFFSNGKQKSAAARSALSLAKSADSSILNQESSNDAPTFHILTGPDGKGFVIVSGEEIENPIIGYSLDSEFTAEGELPAGLADFLSEIDTQVRKLREYNAKKPQKATAARSAMQRTNYNATTMGNKVYLETASWGQDYPFNSQCFTSYNGSTNAPTGCVPTAYAIIMRYHEWPLVGTGTTLYNCQAPTYVEITDRTYDYSKMPLVYDGNWSTEQINEVAKLMSHIGHSFMVTYGSSQTSVSDPQNTDKPNKYFNYSLVYASYQANFTIDAWKEKIKESIDNGCPIPYASDNAGTGDTRHMFVLDGYTENDYFHFNFGWKGQGNGWFKLDAITPSQGDDYSWQSGADHYAIFNLTPNKTNYEVNASVSPANAGTVSLNGSAAASSASGEYIEGTNVTLTATANSGYTFIGWYNGDTKVSSKSEYTFTPTADGTYIAKFQTVAASECNIPSDNTLRYYRLAIPVTYSSYVQDLNANVDTVVKFWRECEEFVNKMFVPLGFCFNVIEDQRLIKSDYFNNEESEDFVIDYLQPNGTSYTNNLIGEDSYDVGMWVHHRDIEAENSGLSAEGGAYFSTQKGSGYSKTDKWVVAHELGHMFGAPHTYTGEGSLMDSGGDDFFSYPSIKKIRDLANENGTTGANKATQVNNNAPVFVNANMNNVYKIPQGACMAIPVYANDTDGNILTYSAIGCSSSTVGNIIEGGSMPHFASKIPQRNSVIDYSPKYTADIFYPNDYYAVAGTNIHEMSAGSYDIAILVNDVPASTEYDYLISNPFYSNYAVWDATVQIVSGTSFAASITPSQESYTAGETVTVTWGVNENHFNSDSRLRITMSTDYGNTFSYVLADDVPALDGSKDVTLPNVTVGNVDVDFTTATRSMRGGIIRVEEIGGIAYTLTTLTPENGGGFTITGGASTPEPTQFTATTTASPAEGGTATIAVGTDPATTSITVTSGTQAKLYAVASPGYEFVNWTSGTSIISNKATTDVTITANSDYVAHFEKNATTYTISVSASTGGKATVAEGTGAGSNSIVVENGTSVTLTATPDSGYRFVNWTNGTSTVSTEATCTVEATANAEYVANFEKEAVATEYPTLTGGTNDDNYLTSVTTTGGKTNISYSANEHPSQLLVVVPGKVQLEKGQSFTMNLVANSLGEGSNSITREDMRYCHASLFTDFDRNYTFEETPVQTWGNKPPTHNVYGNYDQVMNITHTITVPDDAPIGESHIRVIYTNAWKNWPKDGSTELDKGIAYDIVVEVVEATTGLGEKWYRIKDNASGKYIDINKNGATGTSYGNVIMSVKDENSERQIIYFETSGDGYKLKAATGDYIKCETWNVSAGDESEAAVLLFEETGDNYYIKWNHTSYENNIRYFKVETPNGGGDGELHPYDDATSTNAAAIWSLEEVKYTISVSASEGGTAKVATDGGEGSASVEVSYDGSVTLTATPESGYTFVNWTNGGVPAGEDAELIVTNIKADAEYVANFEKEQQSGTFPDGAYKIHWKQDNRGYLAYHTSYPDEAKLADVTLGDYGSNHFDSSKDPVDLVWYLITAQDGNRYLFHAATGKFLAANANVNPTPTSKANKLSTNEALPIRIEENTAHSGHYVLMATVNSTDALLSSGCAASSTGGNPVRWWYNSSDANFMSDGGSPLQLEKVDISVNEDIMNNVLLVIDGIDITANASEGGSVTINGEATGTKRVIKGSNVTVNAIPASGYNFLNWSNTEGIVSENAEYTFTANSATTLTANFEEEPAAGGDEEEKNFVTNSTSGATSEQNPNTNENTFYKVWTMTSPNIVITSSGYTISANSNGISLRTADSYTISAPDGYEIVSYTIYFNAYDNATITVDDKSNSIANANNQTFTVENINEESTSFGLTTANDGRYIQVTSIDMVMRVTGYTISVVAGDGGNAYVGATGTATETTITAGESVTLRAIAEEGYEFDGWYNEAHNRVSTNAEYTFNPTQTGTYTALFLSIVETGKYYTIQCEGSNQYYLSSDVDNNNNNRLIMNGTNRLFYYDESNKLLAYTSGYYVGARKQDDTYDITVMDQFNEESYPIKINVASNDNVMIGVEYRYIVDEEEQITFCYLDGNGSNVASNTNIIKDNNHMWRFEEVTSIPVTIGPAQHATLFAPVALEIPEGVRAYILDASDITVTSTDVTLNRLSSIIPANTGVILKGAQGTYNFNITTSTDEAEAEAKNNALSGTVACTILQQDAYILAVREGKVGLYPLSTNSYLPGQSIATAFFKNGSHKAFLPVNNDALGEILKKGVGFRFFFEDDIATGIKDGILYDGAENENIYDLQGRKLSEITKPGIYIVNGKKVLIK